MMTSPKNTLTQKLTLIIVLFMIAGMGGLYVYKCLFSEYTLGSLNVPTKGYDVISVATPYIIEGVDINVFIYKKDGQLERKILVGIVDTISDAKRDYSKMILYENEIYFPNAYKMINLGDLSLKDGVFNENAGK